MELERNKRKADKRGFSADKKEKKPRKYEVSFLMSHQNHIDEQLAKKQDEGWEIAGDILIKNETGHCTNHYLHIPLRRRI